MKNLNWRQWTVALAFLMSVSIGVFFTERATRPAIYWHHHQDEPIRPWMDIGYIAHSYHVPSYVLYQPLGLAQKPPNKLPIRDVARAQNRSVSEVIVILQNAIVHARPPYPPPVPPASDPGKSP